MTPRRLVTFMRAIIYSTHVSPTMDNRHWTMARSSIVHRQSSGLARICDSVRFGRLALLTTLAWLLATAASASVPAGQPRPARGEGPSAWTAEDGSFRFVGLHDSSHILRVDTATLPATSRVGSAQAAMTLSPGSAQALSLAPDLVMSARYQHAGTTIDGIVFRDWDGDQRQSPGEPGVASVRVIDPDIYQYFIPGDDNNTYQAFADQLASSGCLPTPLPDPVSHTLVSIISLTGSANGTQVFYDHWEDGYDTDPLAAGSTTEVFTLNAGQVRLLQNEIPIPRAPANLLYDGLDRITIIGQPIAVVRAGWLTSPGPLLAGAWEVPRVSTWGQRYVIPVGEDLGRGGSLPLGDFDYVSSTVMAAYDGTDVQIDADADGVFERTATLAAGQTIFLRGSVDPSVVSIHSGAQISASQPVQVQVRAGNCRAPYSGKSYTLIPTERWSNDYWSPVDGFLPGANGCTVGYDPPQPNPADTNVYLYNPNTTPLPVTYEAADGTGVITIPPQSTGSYLSLRPKPITRSNTRGLHFSAPAPFWGVAAADTTALGNNGADFDWSYALLPSNVLSARVVLGWAPGSDATPLTATVNGSTVYVQATANGTIVRADLDGDGAFDQFDTDGDGQVAAGSRYGYDEPNSNQGVMLNRGQTLRISDPNDHDMTGAIISAQDSDHPFMAVYGEDACRATRARPFLDLGYTVLPLPVAQLSKTASLAVDADRSGDVSPGDTLEYMIRAVNTGTGQVLGPTLLDTLPYTYSSFLTGSLLSNPAALPPGVGYDDGSGTFSYVSPNPPGTPDPRILALRATFPDMLPGDTISVTFRVLLGEPLPPEVRALTNRAVLTSPSIQPIVAEVTTQINQADLQIHKTDGQTSVQPGQRLTYTLTYTNAGPGLARNVVLTDTLPAGARDVATPTVPGVITPSIDLAQGVVVLQLGTLQPGQVGNTTISLTLAPDTPRGSEVINTVDIGTSSHDPTSGNNHSEDVDRVPSTTAVVLAELRAERRDGGALIQWRTVAEQDNYGFRVYRGTTPDRASARPISSDLIPGQGRGRGEGASYSVFDAVVPPGPLFYWLEDIDINGVSTFHGPALPGVAGAGERLYLPVVGAR